MMVKAVEQYRDDGSLLNSIILDLSATAEELLATVRNILFNKRNITYNRRFNQWNC